MRRRTALGMTLGAAALASTGTAVAVGRSTVDPVDGHGRVHACYSRRSGSVRLASPGASCPSGLAPLVWNRTGARGPAGKVTGYAVVRRYFTVDTGTQLLADVQCSADKVPIGGGAHYGNSFPGLGNAQWAYVAESSIDEAGTGWAATLVVTPNQGNTFFEVDAICIDGS